MTANLFSGSKHASIYSKFRPSPPHDLIKSVLNFLQKKMLGDLIQEFLEDMRDSIDLQELSRKVSRQYRAEEVNDPWKHAVDIGCGSGQSTVSLAPYFEKVTGCDISESQISCARKERSAQNIEYIISDCEKLPFPDSSIQLVTSSQAIHWFNTSKLFEEVKRVLVPRGVVAVYAYFMPLPKTGNKEKDTKLVKLIEKELHDKQLGKYWHTERLIVKNQYRDIIFPFKNVQRLNTTAKSECSLADYIGFLSSWSAYQKLYNEDKAKGERLLKDVEIQFLEILSAKQPQQEIVFPLHTDYFMLIGHS